MGTSFRVRGCSLPGAKPVDLVADGDTWVVDSVRAMDVTVQGWVLPGRVDAHGGAALSHHARVIDDAAEWKAFMHDDHPRHGLAMANALEGVALARAPA